jgi:Phosphodiester glycosidase
VTPNVAMAMNAGQFKETGPWGWLVLDGEEQRNPLRAPLGIGIRIDTAGRIRWVPPGLEASMRGNRATAFAFQSFPLLFYDRRIPPVLRDASLMNLGHRDARLVMAEGDDGTLLFVLTRYAGLGRVAERVPIGLTTPEAIALVAALGARHAVMLDGGVSAQLLLRDARGEATRWPGLRKVPLALVAEPRAEH